MRGKRERQRERERERERQIQAKDAESDRILINLIERHIMLQTKR